MSSDWKSIWEKIRDWQKLGRTIALATVVDTWGSSPRPTGSYMIIDDQGNIEGSVSGGCIEGAVIMAAQDVVKENRPRILDFSVTNDQAWEVGLSCGGRVRVLVETMTAKLSFVDDILTATDAVELVTDCTTGATTFVKNVDNSQKSKLYEEKDTLVFSRILEQPLKMVVIGAVHITQAMFKIAQSLDIDIVIVDPRTTFANEARFPDVELCTDWPDEALSRYDITSGTAIITLTHDPKLDDPALEVALTSKAFYIASLGSRKTHAARVERLTAKGFSEEQINRIHGPAGFKIGAKSPSEIALSVMAELISVYRLGTGQ